MNIHFYKYHGTGNDFILIDKREKQIDLEKGQIARLCRRRFGIGADGLMLLENEPGYDFRMVYYNSDGNESTMCGNGGRCIAAFAKKLGLINMLTSFVAVDGSHSATVHNDGTISLDMIDVKEIERQDDHLIINTGSPHYIKWVEDVANVDVFGEGRRIRNDQRFVPKGINVNFVQTLGNSLRVRTYERGVEDETLSCGTGVTAAAIALKADQTGKFIVPVETPGGKLEVSFDKGTANTATNVVLKGPAVFVFEGDVLI
jgi:diaminopimelate epimerase